MPSERERGEREKEREGERERDREREKEKGRERVGKLGFKFGIREVRLGLTFGCFGEKQFHCYVEII